MPHPTQVTGDEDPFINQQNDVAGELFMIRNNLKIVPTTVCVYCGEHINPARSKVIITNTCIDCAL